MRSRFISARLKRLDFHLAKFHDARGILKRDRPASILAVLNINGADAVEDDGELRAFSRDLNRIPSTSGFGHRRYLRYIDDGAGTVIRVRAFVVDIHLVGIFRADLLRVGTAYEDAAVRSRINPDLGPDLKICVGILRHQMSTTLISLNDAVLQPPISIADPVPMI